MTSWFEWCWAAAAIPSVTQNFHTLQYLAAGVLDFYRFKGGTIIVANVAVNVTATEELPRVDFEDLGEILSQILLLKMLSSGIISI